ncbi:MAG: TRAP transporter large permease [Planctomycetes bacterium]|nr:TRAP transporter large permease [Planctomycetota bacterium]
MNWLPIILFGSFALLLVLRVPISFALGIASMCCLAYLKVPLSVMSQRVFTSLDSFPTMAIPLFILAGNIMTAGGISRRLIGVASAFLEHRRGGLALACVLACAFFAALSGSGPATVVAIGSMLYPEMVAKGYPKESMAGLITVSGGLGPIIPPSIIMVIYGTQTDTSIGKLFAGGGVCGLILLLSLLAMTYFQARRHHWPFAASRTGGRERLRVVGRGVLALFMPVIILGGIYGGVMTPTESAGVAVVYALFVSMVIYRDLSVRAALRLFRDSAVASSVILFIMATSSVFSWLFAYGGITKTLVSGLTEMDLGYYGVLAFISITLIVFGFFLEGVATVLLLMPVMLPLAQSVNISPIHLGMIVTITNVVGCMTPPVAVNIFACSTFTKLSVERVSRGEIPYLLTMVAVLVLVIVLFPLTGW